MVRLFSHYVPSLTVFRVTLETLLLFAVVITAILLQAPNVGHSLAAVALPAVLFSALMATLMSALGLYQKNLQQSFAAVVGRVVFAFLVGFPVAYFIFQLLPEVGSYESVLGVTTCFALGSVLVLRAATYARSTDGSIFASRVLVVGTGTDAAAVRDAIENSRSGSHCIAAFFPVESDGDVSVPQDMVIRSRASIMDLVRRFEIDEIVVAVRERRGGVLPMQQLLECKLAGVRVTDLSTFFERMYGQVRVESLRASWLIYGEGFRQGWARSFVKRSFDVVVSLALLLITMPIIALTALLIVIESGFPLIYRQERVGKGGRTFEVLKFRSMRTDAEADGKPRWAGSNDSRVTRIGKFIRRTRIDELPQIVNVLKGDMSFVGPRPERPFFVDQLSGQIPYYMTRHSVKPGITGWAQVRYAYGASVDDAFQKLQYDLYYVKNHSLFLDILILFQTVRVVISGDGVR
ncbi:MAG: TIGR03013 family PEP-CTERM/XrtA system glycosyltransferase [Rhodocyclaceae bacterium]|nr:TIGR03013 family PEP-CTERM/XrtA system glycosyltransferase [Rhodocyclaceae bacterium]